MIQSRCEYVLLKRNRNVRTAKPSTSNAALALICMGHPGPINPVIRNASIRIKLPVSKDPKR
jgi:hypothetical protein